MTGKYPSSYGTKGQFMAMSQGAAVGMRTLVEAQVDFKKSRNMIVVGLILVFGLGVSGLSTPLAIGDVAISGLALAAVIGVAANLILPLTEEDEEVALPADEMVS